MSAAAAPAAPRMSLLCISALVGCRAGTPAISADPGCPEPAVEIERGCCDYGDGDGYVPKARHGLLLWSAQQAAGLENQHGKEEAQGRVECGRKQSPAPG